MPRARTVPPENSAWKKERPSDSGSRRRSASRALAASGRAPDLKEALRTPILRGPLLSPRRSW